MKSVKWKTLFLTSFVCLLPAGLWIGVWDKLPDMIAIHFNINMEPDNYAPKAVVAFGFPLMMALVQFACCIVNDTGEKKRGMDKKVELVMKWLVPVMSIVLQIITMGYALGWNIDIRKSISLLMGVIFMVVGNCVPKLDYVKNYKLDTEKARKINRFTGYATIAMGLLMLVSLLLPPVAMIAWVYLLIPYGLACTIYGIKIAKSKR